MFLYGFNYSYGNYIAMSTNAGSSWSLTNIPNNYDNHKLLTFDINSGNSIKFRVL